MQGGAEADLPLAAASVTANAYNIIIEHIFDWADRLKGSISANSAREIYGLLYNAKDAGGTYVRAGNIYPNREGVC